MATLVPDGSSWHLILKEAADKWKQVSGGRVTVRLFPGGVAGDDPDVVRKMRLGTLNAGAPHLGGRRRDRQVGLRDGHPADVRLVRRGLLGPREDAAEARGEPRGEGLRGPQLGRRRLGATSSRRSRWRCPTTSASSSSSPGRATRSRWRCGARPASTPCPCPRPRSRPRCRPGLVEALGSPPQVAVISQFFNHAKNMTDLRWQLLQGATIITKATWEKIPADVRPELLRVSQEAGARLQKEIREAEAKDVEAMKKRGLTVVPVSAAQRAQWQKLTESIYPRIRGKVVPGRGLRRGDALPRRVPEAAGRGGREVTAEGGAGRGRPLRAARVRGRPGGAPAGARLPDRRPARRRLPAPRRHPGPALRRPRARPAPTTSSRSCCGWRSWAASSRPASTGTCRSPPPSSSARAGCGGSAACWPGPSRPRPSGSWPTPRSASSSRTARRAARSWAACRCGSSSW